MGLMFDGVDLKQRFGFTVTEVNGRGSPSVSRTLLEMEYVDGAIELAKKLNSRNLTIRGYVYGENLQMKKNDLINLISRSYAEEKELIFPDTNRSIFVKLNGEPFVLGPVGPSLNAAAYEITFDFIAHDPVFYGDFHDEEGGSLIPLKVGAPTYFITPSRTFLKREPTITIQPYTCVNLLGAYGNFETGTGIGTGWTNTGTTATLDNDCIFGSKSQKITVTYSSGSQYISRDVAVKNTHKYFVSMYLKNFTDAATNDVLGKVEFGTTTISNAAIYDVWTKVFGVYTATTTGNQTLKINLTSASSVVGKTYTQWIDGVMVVNLTEMGKLPPLLNDYFLATHRINNWSDLATENYIENKFGYRIRGTEWLATLLKYYEMWQIDRSIEVYEKVKYAPDIDYFCEADCIPLPASIYEYFPSVFGILNNTVPEGLYLTVDEFSDLKTSLTFQSELIGYNSYFDYFDGENIQKRWKKKVGTTDESGNIALQGYQTGTIVIAVNEVNGEVKTVDVAATLNLGWVNTNVTVYYVGTTVETEKLSYTNELIAFPENNIIVGDNLAMKIDGRRKYLEG